MISTFLLGTLGLTRLPGEQQPISTYIKEIMIVNASTGIAYHTVSYILDL